MKGRLPAAGGSACFVERRQAASGCSPGVVCWKAGCQRLQAVHATRSKGTQSALSAQVIVQEPCLPSNVPSSCCSAACVHVWAGCSSMVAAARLQCTIVIVCLLVAWAAHDLGLRTRLLLASMLAIPYLKAWKMD